VHTRQVEHQLPWDMQQMFDLVADIERYHEFLPGWSAARITQREGDILTVMQAIELGPLRLEFESRAELQRPERLRVSSSGGPFRQFLLDWRFRPAPRAGCIVALEVSMEMRSILLEAAGKRLLDLMTRDIFMRFRERARALYGDHNTSLPLP
jgi:coenzyme Q-binding protein COQ10